MSFEIFKKKIFFITGYGNEHAIELNELYICPPPADISVLKPI